MRMREPIRWLISIEKRLARVEASLEKRQWLARVVMSYGQYLLATLVVWLALSGRLTLQEAAELLAKLPR